MSDDEAPITKKKTLKKTVVDDSDDDAPKTKKSSKLKKKADSDSDEDPAPKKKGIGKKKAAEAAKQDDDENDHVMHVFCLPISHAGGSSWTGGSSRSSVRSQSA